MLIKLDPHKMSQSIMMIFKADTEFRFRVSICYWNSHMIVKIIVKIHRYSWTNEHSEWSINFETLKLKF